MNTSLLRRLCHFTIIAGAWFSLGGAIGTAETTSTLERVSAPLASRTVTIRPNLIGQHPRIFFDKPGLEALRQKFKDPRMEPLLKRFVAGASTYLNKKLPVNPPQTEDPFRGFGDRLSNTAMAYLLTGETRYLDNTREWMAALNHFDSWAGDNDLGCAHCLVGMALCYDWLYEELTPLERQETEASLLLHGRRMMVRSNPSKPATYWGWSFFQNHAWVDYNGITFAAMALYDVQRDEMQNWLNYTRNKFQPTYEHLGVDGGNYEGPAYEHYGTQQLLMYVDVLHAFSGESLYDMPYFKKIGRFALTNMMPDWKNVANFGDSGAEGRGRIDDENATKLATLQHDGYLLTYLKKTREAAGEAEPLTALTMIWTDPSIEPKPLTDLPLINFYEDLGLVICRTSWEANAAVVAFHCGPPGGAHLTKDWSSFAGANAAFSHVHPAAGSFLFWADHQWRISAPGGYTHLKLTHNENVWLVGGLGQRGEAKWFNARSYLDKPEQAKLVTIATSPAADYLVGEAAPAYQPACGLVSFCRHIVFVKSARPYLVILDSLKASQPQTWTSYLHADEAFTLGTNATDFQIGEGKHRTFCTQFGPTKIANATRPLTVVRHPDDKEVERGFELATSPEGASDSTWLVTVIALDEQKVRLLHAAPAVSVEVGNDKITWDASGNVTLNAAPIAKNLLSSTRSPDL